MDTKVEVEMVLWYCSFMVLWKLFTAPVHVLTDTFSFLLSTLSFILYPLSLTLYPLVA